MCPVSLPNKLSLFVSCAGGVEPLLEEELKRFLPPGVRSKVEPLRGGCGLIGSLEDAMQINLESRLAQRVLIELIEGPYRHEDDLYVLAGRVDWSDWITPRETIRVDTIAQRSPLKSLNFTTLRIKDAICDQLREQTGKAPQRGHAFARPAGAAARRPRARGAVCGHLGRAAVQARLACRQG